MALMDILTWRRQSAHERLTTFLKSYIKSNLSVLSGRCAPEHQHIYADPRTSAQWQELRATGRIESWYYSDSAKRIKPGLSQA
jgi:hypothetical protein